MIIRRGFGDDSTSPSLGIPGFSDWANTQDWSALLSGFFTQQYGPLPMWAWTGGALVVWWWLFMPHGSEYRAARRKLRYEHSGVGKIRRRGKKVKSGLKAATS